MKTNLKKRIIPKLLIQNKTYGRISKPVLVTTRLYEKVFEVGDPVSQAKIYEAQLADELIILNIDGRPIAQEAALLDVIERLASETFMPITVGGGVTTTADFELLLSSGADKVSINSAAIKEPKLITKAANRFGDQCVVVSIDFKPDPSSGEYRVFAEGGREETAKNLFEWSCAAESLGAGELVLTDISRDGQARGLNTEACREVSDKVNIPVILSGGCGESDHFARGFIDGHAEAIAAGTFFSFRDQNPMQARAHVRSAGINIRTET